MDGHPEPAAAAARIRSAIEELERDVTGRDEDHFTERLALADAVEIILDRVERLIQDVPDDDLGGLRAELGSLADRAKRLRGSLEAIDERWFARLREDVRAGRLRGAAFREVLARYANDGRTNDPGGPHLTRARAGETRASADPNREDPALVGYDALDDFVNGLLLPNPLPAESVSLSPQMVSYQQTPVRVVLELVERARLTPADVFFDLGSGSGRVSMLVNLLTGVPASGVEIDPVYVRYANERAAGLDLRQVRFASGDARAADYSEATVFFLYTPFRGTVLRAVLGRLEARARQRGVRVFAWGPCIPHLRTERWLKEEPDAPSGLVTGLAAFASR